MRNLRLLVLAPLLGATIMLAGCGPQLAKFESFVSAATSTFTNPVSSTNLYQAKVAFAATQELVLMYQRDCFGSDARPYPVTYAMIKADPVLSLECSHRVSRYNAMKVAENRANAAISAADEFIAKNPSGNAASYVAAAWAAVNNYRAKAGA